MEKLIDRVKTMISYNLTKTEIATRLGDEGIDQGTIFLAWHAAQILLADEA